MSDINGVTGTVRSRSREKQTPQPLFSVNGLSLSVCVVMMSGVATGSYAAPTSTIAGFDLATLQARGISPSVAQYFRSAPRFSEGLRVVDLTVNGERIGLTDARFDSEGELCFTRALLERAGLRVPSSVIDGRAAADHACHDFRAEYPKTVTTLRPGSEEVALVVPTDALHDGQRGSGSYARGGTAALLNYDIQAVNSHSRADTNRYMSASTEVGFNLGDWIARSRQLYIANDRNTTTEHLYAYAQRDFAPLASTFQVGQVSGISPVFGGVQLMGAQLFPDGIENRAANAGVLVEGQALSQSRVEVRQSGALIYTTVVPEGPFALKNLPLLNGTSDLNVTVIDTRGGQRSFVVPAASFRAAVPVKSGYAASVGKIRDVERRGAREPLMGMGSGTWAVGRNSALSAGVQATEGYNSLGWALDSNFSQRFSVGVRNNLSRDHSKKVQGARSSISVGAALPWDVQMALSATTQTQGYRDVLDAVSREGHEGSRFKNQYTAGFSWADPLFGGFSIGYTRGSHFNSRTSEHVYGSWNKNFMYANVGVTVDSQVGQSSQAKDKGRNDDGVGVRLQVSVPLGGDRSLSTYARRQGLRSSIGTAYDERVDETLNYQVRSDHELGEPAGNTLGATLNTTSRYAQVGLGINRDSYNTSYSGQVQGGVVAHSEGVTLSPYPVEDTFGVVSVGDIPGARITTPQGPVWTDPWGKAVIAALPAYQTSQLEVEGKSLPKQVDIKNGTRTLEAGRGSFSQVNFDVVKVRRVLLRATDSGGEPLPQGAAVLGVDNTFLTTVVGDGMIFLSNADALKTLKVSSSNATSCVLKLDLAEQTNDGQFYETASATCR
ncbi:Outer membrane usher protein YraJ [Pseudomonas extremaustralis]|uniref:Outer membrane usher protein YraJ n=1 Tax=Pseudomonas extremaustralis TaxID=359110 RepID=A0A5M9IMA6_9PSED|nr:fimbria/pilus outer membrane usher protein [Pseudomonas extremaustralis]KAA8557687.1 Outer membrane usher protein YraJ [Pseudomonas extremaustralis]